MASRGRGGRRRRLAGGGQVEGRAEGGTGGSASGSSTLAVVAVMAVIRARRRVQVPLNEGGLLALYTEGGRPAACDGWCHLITGGVGRHQGSVGERPTARRREAERRQMFQGRCEGQPSCVVCLRYAQEPADATYGPSEGNHRVKRTQTDPQCIRGAVVRIIMLWLPRNAW